MEITRNVILDLLPLYLANEVSADTRVLIEKYLKNDPELINVAKKLAAMEKPNDILSPLKPDDTMKAFRKAKRLILFHTLILAGVISIVCVIILRFFFTSS